LDPTEAGFEDEVLSDVLFGIDETLCGCCVLSNVFASLCGSVMEDAKLSAFVEMIVEYGVVVRGSSVFSFLALIVWMKL